MDHCALVEGASDQNFAKKLVHRSLASSFRVILWLVSPIPTFYLADLISH